MLISEVDISGWTGLYHYFHFVAEDILAGFATLAAVPSHRLADRSRTDHSGYPNRVLVPWESGWQDKWGLNKMTVDGLFDGSECTESTLLISRLTVNLLCRRDRQNSVGEVDSR